MLVVGPRKMINKIITILKRIIITICSIAAVLIGAYCVMWWGCGGKLMATGNIHANLAWDLATFVEHHNGRLPHDWNEFEHAARKTDGSVKWGAKATARHVRLNQPPYRETKDGRPIYVEILDPKTRASENMINLSIWDALENFKDKRDKGQPTARGDGMPPPQP